MTSAVKEVTTNLLEDFNEEREALPPSTARCIPPSLSQGFIHPSKNPSLSPPSPKSPLDKNSDSEISISSPDSSPIPNTFDYPDEVICDQSFGEVIQGLFDETENQKKTDFIPPFFEEAGIQLFQISSSQ